MIPWRIERTIDLTLWQRGTERLGALMYTGSSKGHRLELRMLDSGQAAQIDGDARAYFMHYTNGKAESMVPVAGTVQGNQILVEFPAEAYQTGQNVVIVRTEKQGVSVPVYAGSYHVQEGEAEVVIDPEDIVPNLSEILAQISAVRAATADAVNATNTANRNEQARATAEKQRVQNENARVTNENSRATAESQRAQSESGRVAAEKNRIVAENKRVQNESARAIAEQERTASEDHRIQAEKERDSAEQIRVNAEKNRLETDKKLSENEENRAHSFEQYDGDICQLKKDIASNGLAVNVFDGQFQNGYYASSDGHYVSSESNNEICATNKVKCHSGDVIKIKFPIKISSSRCVVYDANSSLIYTKYFENTESDASGIDVVEFTIPENGVYFAFNETTNGKSISGTEVYINLENIKDAIQSNADAIQINADAIQSVYDAFTNQTKSFKRLITLKNAKLVSLIGISLFPATVELTGKNVLDTKSKVINIIKNDSGEEITDNSFYYSKFIPVTPNENLYFNFGAQRIYQYSYDKSWLRRTSSRDIASKLGAFVVPNDCYFIQVQAQRNSVNLASAMVTREQDESEYEKYCQYELTISNTDNLPVSLPVYGDTTFYCGENTEVTIQYNESDGITIPACTQYSVWEPSEAPDDYSSEIGPNKVTISITLAQFLSQYFDTYIGEHTNGYTVTKRSIGRESSNEYELLEYCF